MLHGPQKVVECLLCAAIVAILFGGDRLFVSAQYNYNMRNRYNMASHYEAYGPGQQDMRPEGAQMEEEEDERPRINFGIRLRVPAMKLELPRFNLPKITVTAKIRQPDGPRVIKLPAINLDTSSRVETPSSAAERPTNQQAAFQQHSEDYRGFDDVNMNDVKHYGRFPNSPANRLKQQQQQSGYYQGQNLANSNYAGAASNYYSTDAYRAASPQNYRHSRNRFY